MKSSITHSDGPQVKKGVERNVSRSTVEPLFSAVFTEMDASPISGKMPDSFVRSNAGIIQTKLQIGAADDQFEREADAIADQVLSQSEKEGSSTSPSDQQAKSNEAPALKAMPSPMVRLSSAPSGLAQRKCEQCEKEEAQETEDANQEMVQTKQFDALGDDGQGETPAIQRKCAKCEEEEALQMKSLGGGIRVPSKSFEQGLKQELGGGRQLDTELQANLGKQMGADFGRVRIHDGQVAASLSKQINAKAFTRGNDVFFGEGQFQPQTKPGLHLLAHELAHTIQQGGSPSQAVLSTKANEEIVQRTCDDLAAEFANLDTDNISGAERRRLDRRVRECAVQNLENFRVLLTRLPASPLDHTTEISERYQELSSRIDIAMGELESQRQTTMVVVIYNYFEALNSALSRNKVLAYSTILDTSIYQSNLSAVASILDEADTQDPDRARELRDLTSELERNPENLFLRSEATALYNSIGASPIDTGSGEIASNPDADFESAPNEPAYPAHITGPETMVKNGTGTYTMSLDYSIVGGGLLGQVASAFNYVGYTWEFYDITTLVQQRLQERAAAIRAAVNGANPEASPEVSDTEMAIDQVTSQAPNAESEVGLLDAAGRRWERFGDASLQEMEDNWEDFTNPSAGSDGSFIGDISTSIIGEFNLQTTGLGLAVGALGELLMTVTDLFGAGSNEKEIPFPDREGWFLVRGIATPSPAGTEEDPVIRASSVASTMVRVRDIRDYTREQRQDVDDTLRARLAELETALLNATDAQEITTIEADIAAIRTEMGEDVLAILRGRIAQLTALQSRASDPAHARALQQRIDELTMALGTAEERQDDFQSGTIIRPRAVFVSEEAGSSYPMLLQLGQVSHRGGTFHYRLSDSSRSSGSQYDGYGDSRSQAAHRAIIQFTREAPYGRGLLNITLLDGSGFSLPQEEYECRTRGGALALERLEELATVLTVLGLMAVPYAGQVALAIGAGMAANRIYQRIQDHTFQWDTTTFTDIVTVLGAAASGAAAIGRMRVLRNARLFAVVADDADVVRLLAALNSTASRLELLEDMVNWGGYLLGNAVTLGTLADIYAQETIGAMSHAEARRRRAELMLSAVRDGVFQFAGFDARETSRRIHDSFAPIPGGGADGSSAHPSSSPHLPEGASPEHSDGSAPVHHEDGVRDAPSSEIPRTEIDAPPREAAPDASNPAQPGEATVPNPRQTLSSGEVEAGLSTLRTNLEAMPAILEELLRYDHQLLQRAIDDPGLITRENLRAWTEIAMLSPMHPDTYAVLLANDGLRMALLENPAARAALKHCASPCFPSNASADDIQALQALLAERAAAGLSTDMRALNEFLYQHRGEADLGEIIGALRRDFDGTMSQFGPAELSLPSGWAEGEPGRPPMLSSVLAKFETQNLPNGLLNAILTRIAASGNAVNDIGTLNSALAARERSASQLHFDRVLYAVADAGHHQLGMILLGRLTHPQSKDLMQTILTRFPIAELAALHPNHIDLSIPDGIAQIHDFARYGGLATAEQILSLARSAIYPPLADGASPTPEQLSAGIQRLRELLQRNGTEGTLRPAEILEQIQRLNDARTAAAAGSATLPLVERDVANSGSDTGAIVGDLLSYLHQILITGDSSQALADGMASAAFGEQLFNNTADFSSFVGTTEVMRAQYTAFVEQLFLSRTGRAPTATELTAIVNRTWNPKRGDFFEVVATSSLRMAFGEGHALGEYLLEFPDGRTYPDGTVLQTSATTLTVTFLEYKTGGSTRSDGQGALQSLVLAGTPDLATQLRTRRTIRGSGDALDHALRDARRNGLTIQFRYVFVQENP